MIDGKNIFGQPIKNNEITYKRIRKIATGQGDDYANGCLLDYTHFRKNYKMIAIDNRFKLQKFSRLTLLKLQIAPVSQESFSFLKKEKKLSWNFQKEL